MMGVATRSGLKSTPPPLYRTAKTAKTATDTAQPKQKNPVLLDLLKRGNAMAPHGVVPQELRGDGPPLEPTSRASRAAVLKLKTMRWDKALIECDIL